MSKAKLEYPDCYGHLKGFPAYHRGICMDIDGIPKNATKEDCINECPFGFGLRADGRIIPGLRAQEWINKSIQKE